jgi:hypothetical protein
MPAEKRGNVLENGQVAELGPSMGYYSKFLRNLAKGEKHVIVFLRIVSPRFP